MSSTQLLFEFFDPPLQPLDLGRLLFDQREEFFVARFPLCYLVSLLRREMCTI